MNKYKLCVISLYLIFLIAFFGSAFYVRNKNRTSYSDAKNCIKNELYSDAVLHIRDIHNYQEYKDCDKLLTYAETGVKYSEAINLYDEERYTSALTIFESIESFKDSKEYIKDIKYTLAVKLFRKGEYRDSEKIFIEIGNYKDSETYVKNICKELEDENIKIVYLDAVEKYQNQEYELALDSLYFIESFNYKDTKELIKKCEMKLKEE